MTLWAAGRRYRAGQRGRCNSHGADLRGVRAAARDPAAGPGGSRPDGRADEDSDGARVLVHDDGGAGDRAGYEGEAGVRGDRLRAGVGHGAEQLVAGEELRAAGRAGDHDRGGAVPVPGGAVQPVADRDGGCGDPRDDVQLDHEVRRGHPEGPVREHRAVGRVDDVSGDRGPDEQGDHGAGTVEHEDQGGGASGEEVQRVDRRVDLGISEHFPAGTCVGGNVEVVWIGWNR